MLLYGYRYECLDSIDGDDCDITAAWILSCNKAGVSYGSDIIISSDISELRSVTALKGLVLLFVKNQLKATQLIGGTGSYSNMIHCALDLLHIGIALVIIACDGMQEKTPSDHHWLAAHQFVGLHISLVGFPGFQFLFLILKGIITVDDLDQAAGTVIIVAATGGKVYINLDNGSFNPCVIDVGVGNIFVRGVRIGLKSEHCWDLQV